MVTIPTLFPLYSMTLALAVKGTDGAEVRLARHVNEDKQHREKPEALGISVGRGQLILNG